MTDKSKVGKHHYVVEPFQEDFTGRLSWSVLGNQLLKCASLHANEHGFGLIRLHESNYAWVLSRLVVEMHEMPCTGDEYTIETWICDLYRLFTDRCFAITGPNGKVYGYAYSIWAMINMDTRKPAVLEKIVNDEFRSCLIKDTKCAVRQPGKIKIKSETPIRTLDTYYSDIDINGHVNSMRYVEMMLDLFPLQKFKEQTVKRIEVAYSVESYCGDVLSLYLQEVDDQTYAVEIKKNAVSASPGEVVCRGAVTFDKE